MHVLLPSASGSHVSPGRIAVMNRTWGIVFGTVIVFGLVWLVRTDGYYISGNNLLRTVLLMAAFTFFYSKMSPLVNSISSRIKQHFFPVQTENAELDHGSLRRTAIERLEREHTVKVSSYKERVLEPREEARLRREEDKLNRVTDPIWRTPGHRLGMIELPVEPDQDSAGVVTVMLRTPQGRLHQRRFHSSNNVQALFRYMTTIGYHESLHTLVTSYPRRSLSDVKERSMAEAGIVGRVTLNIEQIDP